MIIKSKEIRKRLRAVWPKLRHIWCDDSIYETLSTSQVDALLLDSAVENNTYIDIKNECEEFALFLLCESKKANILQESVGYSWVFGVARARKHKGFFFAHKLNIFLTDNKVYLVEPQTDEYWEADPKNDDIYFVDFN
jgi:hypothetical protein